MACKGSASAELFICTTCNKNKYDTTCASCRKPSGAGTVAKACDTHKGMKETCIKCGKPKGNVTTRPMKICSDCNKGMDWGHKCAASFCGGLA